MSATSSDRLSFHDRQVGEDGTELEEGDIIDDLISLARLRPGATRSISAENPDGAVGGGGRATEGTGAQAARDLGRGWKVSPSIDIGAGQTADLAVIEGPGEIRHIWLTTHPSNWRRLVLRAYWDGSAEPAIEVPVGDFFGQGWGAFAQLSSVPVAVNPHGGFNCYWPMPFRHGARISLENTADSSERVYFQVTYQTGEPAGESYLHAQWRRSNPVVTGGPHVLLDGVTGRGHYVGTYLAWGANSSGWWGEGEVKFYLDDDEEFPTICGTGTEDYFGGAWNFDVPGPGLRRVQHALPRPAPGAPARRPLRQPAAVRDVPLAPPGPDHLRVQNARRRPGPRLAQRRPLPPAARRHRLHGVLLPRRSGHRPPAGPYGRRDGDRLRQPMRPELSKDRGGPSTGSGHSYVTGRLR